MKSLFLFDTMEYYDTLKWLGTPKHHFLGSIINRPLPYNLQDARGSWPYQSLPTLEFINELAKSKKIVNFTTVIRPDIEHTKYELTLHEISQHYTTSFKPLKEHLCHNASLTPAQEEYSSRTRKRLEIAKKEFSVQREIFSNTHMIIADWQRELQQFRNIPLISSPDKTHFSLLSQLKSDVKDNLVCLTLRKQSDGTLHGILLAGFDPCNNSWHAHSALTTKYARSFFGTYLLFDRTINILGHHNIWFGGAPNAQNGSGVFQFKQKFANMTSFAHIFSVDLIPQDLQKLRTNLGYFEYFPDYRNPHMNLGITNRC